MDILLNQKQKTFSNHYLERNDLMSEFFISVVAASIIFLFLDIFGYIDKIEEFIFSKILHYEPIENNDEECYNRDNKN